jgi:hypothetical protein
MNVRRQRKEDRRIVKKWIKENNTLRKTKEEGGRPI